MIDPRNILGSIFASMLFAAIMTEWLDSCQVLIIQSDKTLIAYLIDLGAIALFTIDKVRHVGCSKSLFLLALTGLIVLFGFANLVKYLATYKQRKLQEERQKLAKLLKE